MNKLLAAAVLAMSFSVPAHAVVVASGSGTLEDSDPTQANRIFRDGVPSTWAASKGFPGTLGGAYVYDLVNVAFASNALQDIFYLITVTNLDSVFTSHATAYLNSFNPGDLGQNYLGDIGSTPNPNQSLSFQVIAGAGNSLVLHFSEVSTGNLPSAYSYTVEAFSDARGGENFLTSAAVPEPSTWAMMLAGFGLVGAAMRRKATVKSATVRYA